MARHLAPFSWRQRMAEMVRRRSFGCVLPLGRHASTNGSKFVHCASDTIALSSFQKEQNARHHKQFKREQALELGSVGKVLRSFRAHALTVPRRDRFGEVSWRTPTDGSISAILKNPAYAGAVRPELPDAHHTWGLAAEGPRRKECFTERRPHSPGCRYPAARRSNPTCRAPGTMG